MHQIHTDIILLAVAIEDVARCHGLTQGELTDALHELRPNARAELLEGAATMALGTKAPSLNFFAAPGGVRE
jgi:hypothetical protein